MYTRYPSTRRNPMLSEQHVNHEAARKVLAPASISPAALERMSRFHVEVVQEVALSVAGSPLVVVGMAQNPHVKNVRKALDAAGFTYTYLEYGSYLSKWRERLAIKLWSGWPTFPQVFAQGTLLGGEDLTKAALADGTLRGMIDGRS